MKVLFVTKPLKMEPLGLMYLSSAAKKAGHETKIAITGKDLEETVEDYSPGVIGYSVMTGDQKLYLDLNRELKKKFGFLSIFGGHHPTFFPKLIEEEGVDIICRGEGEEAFVELLGNLGSGRNIDNIDNFFIKNNASIKENPLRNLSDINSLALPDRDIISKIEGVGNSPIKHFIASRGCPFNCSYCFNEQYSSLYAGKGKRVRFREVSSLLDEIKDTVKDPSTKFVYFQDDTFTLNKAWLSEFSEGYSKKINTPFHCHVRANTIDKERVALLKKAGCYSVHIAAETANDRIRNELLNRNMSREQIINASKLLREADIRFMMQNMIGLPTGTLEDDLATLELNIECKPDYAWVSIFQPYPGTTLGDYCKKNGLYEENLDNIESNFFDRSRLNFSAEHQNQIENLQKLFAIIVENPNIHRLGLTKTLINAPNTPSVKEGYKNAYLEFRKKADERLYGFKL